MTRRIAAIALLAAAAAAAGGPAQAAGVSASDAWFRSLGPEVPAGGYFTLANTLDQPAVLTGAGSDACGRLDLHQTILKRPMSARAQGAMPHGDDMGMSAPTMQMRALAAVRVPPRGSVSFTPGGYHLMCEHPSAAIRPGATVTATLRFADGQTLQVPFRVRGPRG